jgi:ABC-type oligopeptide transport system ATPase subunit
MIERDRHRARKRMIERGKHAQIYTNQKHEPPKNQNTHIHTFGHENNTRARDTENKEERATQKNKNKTKLIDQFTFCNLKERKKHKTN